MDKPEFFLQQCTEIEFFSLINLELYFFITAVQLSNSFSVVGFRWTKLLNTCVKSLFFVCEETCFRVILGNPMPLPPGHNWVMKNEIHPQTPALNCVPNIVYIDH